MLTARCRARVHLAVAYAIWLLTPSLSPCAVAVEHVIHISVDGFNPFWMQQVIDAGDAPTLKRLQDEGAWTANARTDFTHTITLPNHTCMLTGRPVLQPAGMPEGIFHGWIINETPPRGATLHNTGNPAAKYIASTFDVAHDAGLSTALYTSKDKFIVYDQSYCENTGARHERGRDKIDVYFFHDDGPPLYSAEMNRRFLADMAARHFNYAFVHYRDTDSAGHSFGWGSPEYLKAVKSVDGYLAQVLKLVETDPQLKGRTTVIVNTDHAGCGTDHSDSKLPVNYRIPVFVWGAGVAHGDLYEMNAGTRQNPGDSQPEYIAPGQPIRNGDTGNLALKLLGLGPIPGSTCNFRQDLRVAPTRNETANRGSDAHSSTEAR